MPNQAGDDGVGGLERWAPAGAMMAVSPIGYIARNTLALLAPTILRDTGAGILRLAGAEQGARGFSRRRG